MKIAFVIFNGMTFLDFIGFYDVIYRLNMFEETKGTTWDICGLSEEISDELGLTVKVNRVKPDLSEYDLLFVPGGMGTRELQYNDEFITWLKQADKVKYKVSVCTGSLLLGAAGFLENKKATTHPNVYELLEPYCAEVIKTRIVKDGDLITAGGVSTSIDLALYIVKLFVNQEAVEIIKQQIDYPYEVQGIIEV
ncbi:cyclohexyl-isocyanide hydratase [Paenibacillus anaericanus]|uniref:DJ-1/PfpI family protein n=1 Tax=Paenibacillus anaericanus TaxID=170367 RepID=UPI0027810902|nr:DJ-1/PfpI family protein [Paenibacillus anaericanus]MDQ0088494.1 cyclohexyl-isocyanide hydratase [Paenibacillus anaericanus]